MASDPPKVLISYSHDSPQHEHHVLELASRLRADGIDCTIDQYLLAPPEGWPRWMEKQIRDSDFVVMVCTETYYQRVMGEEQPGRGLGVRWEGHLIYSEIYRAGTMNTKFIPVLFEGGDPSHIPAPARDTNHYFARTARGYEDLYHRLTNQPRATKQELGKLRSLPPAERKSEGALGRLVNVPDLPPHFLPRPDDLQALKEAVLAGLTKPVALTGTGKFGVQGMGGIGKTVLAAALAHDSEVRQAFPDGVYWLTVGQKPNLPDLKNQLLRQLTGSKGALTTEPEAKDALREALEGRSALVVVDDAWTIDAADAFSVTAPPVRLLITTRNQEVLVGLGAEEHRVDVLSTSDALKMLAEWVGHKSSDKLPPEAAEVAKECGYLPLALAMIGAMIRLRPTAWKDALCRLHRADLGEIKRAFPGYPYPDLLRAIGVSLEGLESVDRERYLDLAVFPEDQAIPEEALRVLWNLDEMDTRDCMTRLVARSLGTWATGETRLILHDLQHDLIRKRREKDLPGLHLRLVEAWDALPKLPDPYAWRWVGYHMVNAGRKDDLRRLLLDFNYLQAKLAVTDDPNTLLADYDYLRDNADLRLVRSAIRLSAHVVARDQRQLAGQLTGRLLGFHDANIEALLKQVSENVPLPWLRPIHADLIPAGDPLIQMLRGHSGTVNGVAMTPNGRRAVSASHDKTLRIWDLESGQSVCTLQGHSDSVRGVAMTPDGCRAVSASWDNTLRVWDPESGQSVRTLEGHSGWVNGAAMTPDGRRAVSASNDETLRVWDLESGQSVHTLQGHSGGVSGVAMTPDGRRAVSASYDETLRVWDLESGQSVHTLQGHSGGVMGVAMTPDGRRAVSASDDTTLRLWDLESGQSVCTLQGHSDLVMGVAMTPDGRRAVSVSCDETLRLWDLESGQSVHTFQGHRALLAGVAMTPDGRRAVSASYDSTLGVWDLESGQSVCTLQGHSGEVRGVAMTPDGRRAVSASNDETLRVWDLESGQSVHTLQGHGGEVSGVAMTPDGHRAVSASYDNTLRVWDLESGQSVRMLLGHSGQSVRMLLGDSGQVIGVAVTSDDQSVRMAIGHSGQVRGVAMTSDGRRAVSASWDETLRVWDLESGQSVRTLQGNSGTVNGVAMTADGRRAVSASYDKTLRVWDLESGQSVCTLQGHSGEVMGVAMTPDGRRAVSASDDTTLRLWDLESGQSVHTLQGHNDQVSGVAMTPDGRRAVSASDDTTLRLWDLNSGKEIATFTGDSWMLSCACAADGRTIIGGDHSGRVHFLRLVEADETTHPIGDTKIQLLQHKEQAKSATDS